MTKLMVFMFLSFTGAFSNFSFAANTAQAAETRDVGRAVVWDDARAKCQNLGAGWDLPTPEQFLALVMTGRGFKIGTEGHAIYPMWIRGTSEEENAALKGQSNIYYLADGRGYDITRLSVSPNAVLEFTADTNSMIQHYNDNLEPMDKTELDAQIESARQLIAAMTGGFEVRCVLGQ
jgi:hypothetical protein